ncbi:hypothetical protein [Peribacillus simplex]|uniref:Uncharacterized protein n=1 Tax=Peribacillus simplex TaxID=1478 RepID=A0AAW7I7A3_9BACI|nr:hypothetical protein [Peribacillus simplex]MDM5451039.1 hypothetical protein [Peribacillus simplex]
MGEEKPRLEQYKELYAKEYDRLQQMQPKSQEYAQLEKRVDRMQDVSERCEFVSSRIDCEQEEKELLKEMKTTIANLAINGTFTSPIIDAGSTMLYTPTVV